MCCVRINPWFSSCTISVSTPVYAVPRRVHALYKLIFSFYKTFFVRTHPSNKGIFLFCYIQPMVCLVKPSTPKVYRRSYIKRFTMNVYYEINT